MGSARSDIFGGVRSRAAGLAVALFLALAAGAPAAAQQKAVFQKALTAVTAPAVSPALHNIGQCMYVVVVLFPTAVVDVSPIQVRIEGSYDNSTWFPISPDITQAKLLGGVVYFIDKGYGVFPYVRVRSLLATPGSLPMTVQYAGHILPVVPVLFETLDRFVL